MTPFVSLTIIVLLFVIIFLVSRIFTLSKSGIIKELKEDNIVLPTVREVPNFNVIDPNFNLLKDVIESAELEQWQSIVKRDHNGYDILLLNSEKTLSISSRIRVYDESMSVFGPIKIAWFQIKKMNGNSQEFVVSYTDDDLSVKYLVLPFIWNYVLKYHQKIYDETISYYNTAMNSIQKELKTLNRDKYLDDILKET